jgi:hypothetical protein
VGPSAHLPDGPSAHLPDGPSAHLPDGPPAHLPDGPSAHLPDGPPATPSACGLGSLAPRDVSAQPLLPNADDIDDGSDDDDDSDECRRETPPAAAGSPKRGGGTAAVVLERPRYGWRPLASIRERAGPFAGFIAVVAAAQVREAACARWSA